MQVHIYEKDYIELIILNQRYDKQEQTNTMYLTQTAGQKQFPI